MRHKVRQSLRVHLAPGKASTTARKKEGVHGTTSATLCTSKAYATPCVEEPRSHTFTTVWRCTSAPMSSSRSVSLM